jgi:uncharacterized protein
MTLLLYATQMGRLSSLRSIVDKGASIAYRDGRGQTALIHVARTGHADVVAYLLDIHHFDVDDRSPDGNTTLIAFADSYHAMRTLEVAELLISHGANVNAVNNRGLSSFLKALQAHTET